MLSHLFDFKYFIQPGHGVELLTVSVVSVLLCLLVVGVIHFVPRQGKRWLLVLLTFLSGLVYAVEYFWPESPTGEPNPVTAGTDIIGNVIQIVMGFTFLLGIYNLVHIHFNNIRRNRPNWTYSIVFFVAFGAMTVAAFWREWLEEHQQKDAPSG